MYTLDMFEMALEWPWGRSLLSVHYKRKLAGVLDIVRRFRGEDKTSSSRFHDSMPKTRTCGNVIRITSAGL